MNKQSSSFLSRQHNNYWNVLFT